MKIVRLSRLIVPGLVLQAVMVGGGYSTGRELVEFFLADGPATALGGIAITAVAFSLTAMLAFELARLFRAHDYRTFCQIYLGRFWVLFELGYVAALLLSLSVVTAATGELIHASVGWPIWTGTAGFMILVSGLLALGSGWIERMFYAAYGAMFVAVLVKFGSALPIAFGAAPFDPVKALLGGMSFTGYNITIVAILIFVARNFTTRREALAAGALTGPLVLLPGVAFLLSLSAFYPAILSSTLPVSAVLSAIGSPLLAFVINLIVLGALLKTGVGLLHGFNERIERAALEKGAPLPFFARPVVALIAISVAAFGATAIGLIDLIGQGYRYSGYYFLVVFLLPLFTRGVWLVVKGGAPQGEGSPKG
jgi:uncharacterized membrane protein YkvI